MCVSRPRVFPWNLTNFHTHVSRSVGRWEVLSRRAQLRRNRLFPPSPQHTNHTNSITDIVDNDLLPETVKNTTSSHRKTLKKQSELAHLIVCCERGSFFSIVVVFVVVVGSVSSSDRKTASFYAAKHINSGSHPDVKISPTILLLRWHSFFSIRVKLVVSHQQPKLLPQAADDRHTPNPKLETSSKAFPIYFFTLFPLSISLPRWKKPKKKLFQWHCALTQVFTLRLDILLRALL